MDRRRLGPPLTTIAVVLSLVAVTNSASAQQPEPDEAAEVADEQTADDAQQTERAASGIRAEASMSMRSVPIGLSWTADVGYRFSLFDSASMFLKNTYLDAGIATRLSPTYLWGGGYVSALPLQVLELRFVAQYLGYLGTFGYILVPDDAQNPDWTLDAFDRSEENDAGVSTTGVLLSAQATPRIKVGNLVITAETQFNWIDVDVDQTYYEPYYDLLLEPTDTFLVTRPMAGWVWTFDALDSWLMTGFRWEHTHVYGADYNRDFASLLALWKIPPKWWSWGNPQLALLGGWWVEHPNRDSGWIGGQLTLEFGAYGSASD